MRAEIDLLVQLCSQLCHLFYIIEESCRCRFAKERETKPKPSPPPSLPPPPLHKASQNERIFFLSFAMWSFFGTSFLFSFSRPSGTYPSVGILALYSFLSFCFCAFLSSSWSISRGGRRRRRPPSSSTTSTPPTPKVRFFPSQDESFPPGPLLVFFTRLETFAGVPSCDATRTPSPRPSAPRPTPRHPLPPPSAPSSLPVWRASLVTRAWWDRAPPTR